MKARKLLDLSLTLRQVRDPIIEVEYRACGRAGSYVRAELVKKHGASVTFSRLRGMSALGYERLVDAAGDTCGTVVIAIRFPSCRRAIEGYRCEMS